MMCKCEDRKECANVRMCGCANVQMNKIGLKFKYSAKLCGQVSRKVCPEIKPTHLYIFAPMIILLLGSGGRESAFAWKIAQSKKCEHLFIAPGNAGTGNYGTNVNIKVTDFEGIGQFALNN